MTPKAAILRRLADLARRMRHANTICPAETVAEVRELEDALDAIEDDLANQIDTLMAHRFETYNRGTVAFDVHGRSGRWNTQRGLRPVAPVRQSA